MAGALIGHNGDFRSLVYQFSDCGSYVYPRYELQELCLAKDIL